MCCYGIPLGYLRSLSRYLDPYPVLFHGVSASREISPPTTAPFNGTDEPDETSFRALRPKTLRLSHFAPHPVSDAANDFIAPCCAMPLRFSLTIPRATSAVEPSRAAVLHEPTVRNVTCICGSHSHTRPWAPSLAGRFTCTDTHSDRLVIQYR